MPSLADLTDNYPQPDNTFPVEQPYLGVPQDANGIRRVYITKADTAIAPDMTKPITDDRPEPQLTTEEYFNKPYKPMPELSSDNMIEKLIKRLAETKFSEGTDLGNTLTGSGGKERYQLWPEKVVREELSAAGNIYNEGTLPPGLRREDITDIPAPTMPTNDSTALGRFLNIAPVAASPADPIIGSAQAMSALAGSGGIAGTGEEAGAALGAGPFLRPALKVGDKIYKAPIKDASNPLGFGAEHSDALPAHLADDFYQKAMNGEDINHYNFGFMNHKGQFLDRSKALDYGINEGLVDPANGRYGMLTSTMLADSSKPGTAIEAMAKTNDLSNAWWHGTASGDLRGGSSGLHLGTKTAATQALEARIGIPADGKGWTGDREYGKTLLAGQDTLKKMDPKGYNVTGYNVDVPKEDYYPTKVLKYPDGTEMPMTVKPEVAPYRLKGSMSNTPNNPYEDFKANGYMKGQLKRGEPKNGYYYKNVGEDSGSISIVVPNGNHVVKLTADSSKPGTAIEAMAKTGKQYPLAKPSDRWANTLGQNDDKLTNMTPDEFLNKSRPLKIDAESRENIDAIKQHIKEGKPLDPLELHANGKEDGRHRAIAAKELGIKQVPVLNFRPSEPFYSALEHGINKLPDEALTGEQWLSKIWEPETTKKVGVRDEKNKVVTDEKGNPVTKEVVVQGKSPLPGVKPEELDWTGVKSFLEERGNQPVTKAELQEHLQNNKVELKEVNKGGGLKPFTDDDVMKRAIDIAHTKGKRFSEYSREQKADLLADARDRLETEQQLASDNTPNTKYHSYQLPGGEPNSYREMLLTLPSQNKFKVVPNPEGSGFSIKYPNGEYEKGFGDKPASWATENLASETGMKYVQGKARGKMADELRAKYGDNFADKWTDKEKQDWNDVTKSTDAYKSSHWDEPNILAHVRMNDRMIDGKKSLHLEEIQSDWHQQGRDRGYKDNLSEAEARELKTLRAKVDSGTHNGDEAVRAAELENKKQAYGGVPDAPFKKSWHELALKRMIREAAEKGYDRLSWTPGEAQAARYDLSKSVNKIAVPMVNKDGTRSVRIDAKGDTPFKLMVDKNGIVDGSHSAAQFSGKPLSDVVGKEMAEKIMKLDASHEYSGLDLKIGGEGMKGFYDQIIPKALEKISGEKVKTTNLVNENKYKNFMDENRKYLKDNGLKDDLINKMNDRQISSAAGKMGEWESLLETKDAFDKYGKQPIHYIDLPQSLKDKALSKGFPLFSSSHAGLMFVPVEGDPFAPKEK